MKASKVFSPVIWNTCILLNSHFFLTSWVVDEHWCFWNAQPMFVVTHAAHARGCTHSPCSWLHTQPVLMVTHVAVGAESQADLQVGKKLAQLQTHSSFLSEFIILDVLGKSAFWETSQSILMINMNYQKISVCTHYSASVRALALRQSTDLNGQPLIIILI